MFSKILKNSIIYSLSPLSSKFVGFILIPIYIEYFTVTDYGVIGILEITSFLLINVLGFGLYWAFNRWYWDEKYIDYQKSIFFTLLVFLTGTSCLFFLIFYTAANPIVELLLGDSSYIFIFRLMVITSMIEIVCQVPLTLMKIQEKAGLYSLSNIIKLITNLVLTIYFIVHLKTGIEGIYLAQFFGGIVYLFLISIYIFKNVECYIIYNI